MNNHTQLFGSYVPGDTALHRMGVGWKYLLIVAGGIVPLIIRHPVVSGAALLGAIAVLWAAKLPLAKTLALPWVFWLLMAGLGVYHSLATHWTVGVTYVLGFLACIYLSRLLIHTTPATDLVDAIATAARPLRVFRLDPDHVALALALMLRSLPYLIGLLGDTRDAARARGLRRRDTWRCLIPFFVSAVAYALTTGDALKARGLTDSHPTL